MSARELINKYKSRELHPFVCEQTGKEKTEEEREKRWEQLQPHMLAMDLAELENNFAWRMADILLRVCGSPDESYADVLVCDVLKAIRQSGYTAYRERRTAWIFPPDRRHPPSEDHSEEVVSRPRDLREKEPAIAKVVAWAEAQQRRIDRVRWALGDAALLLRRRGDDEEWIAVAEEELEDLPEKDGYPSIQQLCALAEAFPPETRQTDKGWELHKLARTPETMAQITACMAEDTEERTFMEVAKYVREFKQMVRRIDREQRERGGK
jgi:hypothetical protein